MSLTDQLNSLKSKLDNKNIKLTENPETSSVATENSQLPEQMLEDEVSGHEPFSKVSLKDDLEYVPVPMAVTAPSVAEVTQTKDPSYQSSVTGMVTEVPGISEEDISRKISQIILKKSIGNKFKETPYEVVSANLIPETVTVRVERHGKNFSQHMDYLKEHFRVSVFPADLINLKPSSGEWRQETFNGKSYYTTSGNPQKVADHFSEVLTTKGFVREPIEVNVDKDAIIFRTLKYTPHEIGVMLHAFRDYGAAVVRANGELFLVMEEI